MKRVLIDLDFGSVYCGQSGPFYASEVHGLWPKGTYKGACRYCGRNEMKQSPSDVFGKASNARSSKAAVFTNFISTAFNSSAPYLFVYWIILSR